MKCGLKIGDIVTSKSMKWPWQTHFIADPNDLEKVPQEMHNDLPKLASCIGLIGLTVLLGIRKKGGLKHFAQLLSSNERYYYISTSVAPEHARARKMPVRSQFLMLEHTRCSIF